MVELPVSVSVEAGVNCEFDSAEELGGEEYPAPFGSGLKLDMVFGEVDRESHGSKERGSWSLTNSCII